MWPILKGNVWGLSLGIIYDSTHFIHKIKNIFLFAHRFTVTKLQLHVLIVAKSYYPSHYAYSLLQVSIYMEHVIQRGQEIRHCPYRFIGLLCSSSPSVQWVLSIHQVTNAAVTMWALLIMCVKEGYRNMLLCHRTWKSSELTWREIKRNNFVMIKYPMSVYQGFSTVSAWGIL